MARYIEPHGYLRRVLGHDEEVLWLAHQHGLFLLGRIFWWLVVAVVITAAVAGGQVGSGNPVVAVGYAFVLLPLIFVWWQWLAWSNHQYVLTSRRVIQLSGVFNKEVIDSLLEKVNDVKTEQPFLGRVFGYGDVEILTTNEIGNNVFHHIADPLGFKRTMLGAQEALHEVGVRG